MYLVINLFNIREISWNVLLPTSNLNPFLKKDEREKLSPKVTYLELANNIENIKLAKDAVTRDILQGNVCKAVVTSGGDELSIGLVPATGEYDDSMEYIQLTYVSSGSVISELLFEFTDENVPKALNKFFIIALQLGDFI